MKHTIMAAALIPACFAFACGTKKDEKKVPAVTLDQSSDSKTSLDSQKNCEDDDVGQNSDVSQNSGCNPAVPVGELRIVKKSSWLNPQFDAGGRLQDDDGDCLDSFTAGRKNENSMASLDMTLKNMNLKNDAARCLMQIRVAYTRGYAFAIRKVGAPVIATIPNNSQAIFKGSYTVQGKKPVLMERSIESRYSEKPVRLEYSVADQDIAWSSCSGDSTLRVDTKMSMDFNGGNQDGSIRIDSKSPYRMEIVWAKCQ
ncbi:MAG TPA: DUF4360 domain-containing protein [Oligoflexus sp.]|uniref:DUF4360 domain-containing protein n=1 Tax=Oligoflexus sp. TaxID=1971216 RepID=UPI002D7EBA19|nr:DUF4360 domain-containing protein [Oligoflexus sp.]HET9236440.1 DUF4360 domain-containing protein [Oligoflexus sp.]